MDFLQCNLPHMYQDNCPNLQLQLSSQQGVYSGALQQFQLAAMVPLAQLLAEDSEALQSILAFKADARLTQLAMRLSEKDWYLSGDFIDLTSVPVGDVPGLQNLTGRFSASQDYIRLDLLGQDGALRWGDAFTRDTAYQTLSGQLEVIQQDGQAWRGCGDSHAGRDACITSRLLAS